MYSAAPRCSEARSDRSLPACWTGPPAAASAAAENSSPVAAAVSRAIHFLVMRRHPFRHRLGLVQLGPQRHGQEEKEVVDGQHAADDGLHRIGTRTGADLAQPHE